MPVFLLVAEGCGCLEDLGPDWNVSGNILALASDESGNPTTASVGHDVVRRHRRSLLPQRALNLAPNATRVFNLTLDQCSVYCATLTTPPLFFAYRTLPGGNSSCACPGAVCTIVTGVPNSTVYEIPKVTLGPTVVPTRAPVTAAPSSSTCQHYKVKSGGTYIAIKHTAMVYIKITNHKRYKSNELPVNSRFLGAAGKPLGKEAPAIAQLALQFMVPPTFTYLKGFSLGVKSPRPTVHVEAGNGSVYWSEIALGPGQVRKFLMFFATNDTCVKRVVPFQAAVFEYDTSQSPWDPATGKYCLRAVTSQVKVRPSLLDFMDQKQGGGWKPSLQGHKQGGGWKKASDNKPTQARCKGTASAASVEEAATTAAGVGNLSLSGTSPFANVLTYYDEEGDWQYDDSSMPVTSAAATAPPSPSADIVEANGAKQGPTVPMEEHAAPNSAPSALVRLDDETKGKPEQSEQTAPSALATRPSAQVAALRNLIIAICITIGSLFLISLLLMHMWRSHRRSHRRRRQGRGLHVEGDGAAGIAQRQRDRTPSPLGVPKNV